MLEDADFNEDFTQHLDVELDKFKEKSQKITRSSDSDDTPQDGRGAMQ